VRVRNLPAPRLLEWDGSFGWIIFEICFLSQDENICQMRHCTQEVFNENSRRDPKAIAPGLEDSAKKKQANVLLPVSHWSNHATHLLDACL
jgi:hypothetical protein